jgi:subtilisin family serine protease
MKPTRARLLPAAVALALLALPALAGDPPPAPDPLEASSLFMPLEATGVLALRRKDPALDGRGAVIAIVDSALDLAHPALQVTTTGAPKVVEARDFSDACVIEIPREIDQSRDIAPDGTIESLDGGRVKVGAIRGKRMRLGLLHEELVRRTALPDLNRDTPEPPPRPPALGEPRPEGPAAPDVSDRFDVLLVLRDDPAAPSGESWWCYVDCNDDQDLEDEPPLRDYAIAREWRSFSKDGTMAFAINVDGAGERVHFLFPHDGHGTHVAAIAAGHDPQGRGFEGVAPGAQIMFLKIGGGRNAQASASGEAMMKAIRWAAEHGADVVNISYGGRGAIVDADNFPAAFLEELIRRTGVAIVFSAGNEGPGIATTNRWIAAEHAFGVARVDLKEASAAQAGLTALRRDQVATSSSRGPTEDGLPAVAIAAPGMAVTAVPLAFGGYDLKQGTSMAAPSATGGLAILVAAMRREGRWRDARALAPEAAFAQLRALRFAVEEGAAPLEGATRLDQGAGLLRVDRALELLPALLQRSNTSKTIEPSGSETVEPTASPLAVRYHVEVESPYEREPGRPARGLVVRSGFKTRDGARFFIRPEFAEGTPLAARAGFVARFRLRSTAPWLKAGNADRPAIEDDPTPGREFVWLRGEEAQRVDLVFDVAALEPGVHFAEVRATPLDDPDGPPAFALPVTYVVPLAFPQAQNWVFEREERDLEAGAVRRIFLDVPPGASAVRVRASSDDPNANALGYAFSPYGEKLAQFALDPVRPPERRPADHEATFLAKAGPGVYELDLVGRTTARAPFAARLRAELVGVAPQAGQSFSFDTRSRTASARLENLFAPLEQAKVEAQATELVRPPREYDEPARDRVEFPLFAPPGVAAVKLRVDLREKASFRYRLSGVRVSVFDERGRLVDTTTVDRAASVLAEADESDVEVKAEEGGLYLVRVERIPMKRDYGFAAADGRIEPAWLADAPPLRFAVEERHVLRTPLGLRAEGLAGAIPALGEAEVRLEGPAAPDAPVPYAAFRGTFAVSDRGVRVAELPIQGPLARAPSAAAARRAWIEAREREVEDARAALAHAEEDLARYGRPGLEERRARAREAAAREGERPADAAVARGLLRELDEALAPGGREAAPEAAKRAAVEDRGRLERLAALFAGPDGFRPGERRAARALVDGRRAAARNVEAAQVLDPATRKAVPLAKALHALAAEKDAAARAALEDAIGRAAREIAEKRPTAWRAPLDELVWVREQAAENRLLERLGRYHRDWLELALGAVGLGGEADLEATIAGAREATRGAVASFERTPGGAPLLARVLAELAERPAKRDPAVELGTDEEGPDPAAIARAVRRAAEALGFDAGGVAIEAGFGDFEPAPAPRAAASPAREPEPSGDEPAPSRPRRGPRGGSRPSAAPPPPRSAADGGEAPKPAEEGPERPLARAAAYVPDRGAAGPAGRADVRLEIRVARAAAPADYAEVVGRAAAEAYLLAALRADHPLDRALPRDPAARGVLRALARRFAAALGAPEEDERARRRAALAERRDIAAVVFALGTSRRDVPGGSGDAPEAAWRKAFQAAFEREPAAGLEAGAGFALDEAIFAGGEDALARLVESAAAREVEAEIAAGRKVPPILEASGIAGGLAGDLAARRSIVCGPRAAGETGAPPARTRAVY